MSFDPDQFLAQTSTPTASASSPSGDFDPDKFLKETESPSVGGFLSNAAEDVKGNVVGLGNLAKGLVTHPIDTISSIPHGLLEEGKRIGVGELLTGHPINAVAKLGSAIYEKPLSTGLDLSAIYGAGSGLVNAMRGGAEAGALAEAGTKAAQTAGEGVAKTATPSLESAERVTGAAPEPLAMPQEASNILKEPISRPEPIPTHTPAPGPASTATGAAQDTLGTLTQKIPADLKNRAQELEQVLTNKYGQIAKRPGLANTLADYAEQHGQNVYAKDIGLSPAQVRKIGIDKTRDLVNYAEQNGLVGPGVGHLGRETIIPQRLEEAGGAVGGFRKMAADRGAVHNVDDLIGQIRSKLDSKYLGKVNLGDLGEVGGMNSGEANAYKQALAEVKRSGGRADQMAQTATKLFSESRKLDKLKQPSGAAADVARIVRQANDNLIGSTLTPEESALYQHALEDYGALTQLNQGVIRRGSTELGGRLGPGSGISRMMVQKFLDSVGYRVEGKVMTKLAKFLRSNPDIVQTPKNLFRHLVDEYAEATDELGETPQ